MNSAIQLITNSRKIAEVLQNNREAAPLVKAGAELVDCGINGTPTTPSEIKQLMGSKHKLFRGFGQQDSHEFISLYLEEARKELHPNKNKYEIFNYDEDKPMRENLEAYTKFLDKFEKSDLMDCMQFVMLKTFVCKDCKTKSHAF